MKVTTAPLNPLAALRTATAVFVLVAAAALPVRGEEATPDAAPPSGNAAQQHARMAKEMIGNPHHALAMAYRQNLINFARSLKMMARHEATLPPDFARTAVGEMRRSADKLEQQHAEAVRTMPEELKAKVGDMPKMMNQHLAEVKGHVLQLEEVVKSSHIDSAAVLKQVDPILQECRMLAAGGMHGMGGGMGMMQHHPIMKEMQARDAELMKLVDQMNAAPADRKTGLMADILTRLVRQRSEMDTRMQEMHGHGMHPMMHGGRNCDCSMMREQSSDEENEDIEMDDSIETE